MLDEVSKRKQTKTQPSFLTAHSFLPSQIGLTHTQTRYLKLPCCL